MQEPVVHDTYGRGNVIKKRYHGCECFVEFTSGVSKWFPHFELEVIKDNDVKDDTSDKVKPLSFTDEDKSSLFGLDDSVVKTPQSAGELSVADSIVGTQTKCSLGSRQSRIIIESLRLGGVPQNHAEDFTYGRNEEIARIMNWLEGNEGSLIITGEYGVGKSHFLEILASRAPHKGWALAKVEIDPNETPFHKPKKIYQHIVNTFSYKKDDTILGFDDFIRGVAESKNSFEKQKLLSHPYFGILINNWDTMDDKSDILDWIKGDGGKPPSFPQMPDYQTAANIYSNLISAIGWSAKNILGMNGIVIIFDEAESVDPSWYTNYQFDKAINFLKGTILMSNNDERLIGDIHPIFYPFGMKSGLRYCGVRSRKKMPFLWESESCTKIIFSFVPEMFESMDTKNYNELKSLFEKMEKIELEALDRTNLEYILQNITNVYDDAYGFSTSHDISNYIPHTDKTRKFIKSVVEGLDLMRFYPEKDLAELLIDYD